MEKFEYEAVLTEDADDGGYVVTFDAFPEAITQGDTVEQALREAADALEEAVAGRIERGEDIPAAPARVSRNRHAVTLPAIMAAKAALYLTVREAGITSKVALAKALHCDEKEARRLLNPHHPTKIGRIEDALAIFGMELVISLKKAA